jgi:two-component system, cell cycle sensor histidine kinase and response regulator CckA
VHTSESAYATVLIIDDEEMLRRSIATMLARKGYSVLDAADGPTAISVFKAHQEAIDVVLLDLTLPGMSGKEILKELRTIRPGVNVVLTTAYGPERALTDAGEQPVYYLRKPYGIKELTSLLRTVSGDEPKPMRAVRAQSGS